MVSELPRFRRDHESIPRASWIVRWDVFGELDRSETHIGFHYEVKFRSLSSLDLFLFDFRIVYCIFWRRCG